jgi:hypothetical protein
MELTTHTEAIRAMWLFKCLKYTAEELDKPIDDTAKLLNEHGLVEYT